MVYRLLIKWEKFFRKSCCAWHFVLLCYLMLALNVHNDAFEDYRCKAFEYVMGRFVLCWTIHCIFVYCTSMVFDYVQLCSIHEYMLEDFYKSFCNIIMGRGKIHDISNIFHNIRVRTHSIPVWQIMTLVWTCCLKLVITNYYLLESGEDLKVISNIMTTFFPP